jgi:hypothetical protein
MLKQKTPFYRAAPGIDPVSDAINFVEILRMVALVSVALCGM